GPDRPRWARSPTRRSGTWRPRSPAPWESSDMEAILPLAAESFGLLSLPSSGSNPIAIVFFNAGFIHRSGPYRLFTRLSRVLAAAGYAVLRFDLPGVGDAPAATD